MNNNSATGNSYPTAMTSLYLSVIGGSSNISQHFFMKKFLLWKVMMRCCNDPTVPSWILWASVTLPLTPSLDGLAKWVLSVNWHSTSPFLWLDVLFAYQADSIHFYSAIFGCSSEPLYHMQLIIVLLELVP